MNIKASYERKQYYTREDMVRILKISESEVKRMERKSRLLFTFIRDKDYQRIVIFPKSWNQSRIKEIKKSRREWKRKMR